MLIKPYNVFARAVLASVLLAYSVTGHTLKVGELFVRSTLNQPFDASIPLNATAREIESLKISIASEEEFKLVGISRPAFLDELTLQAQDIGGRTIIRITSDIPINEPFIHLLLSLQWPNGTVVREYTALIDPPQYLTDTTTDVVLPDSSENKRLPATVESTRYGPVKAGETLSRIATRVDRPAGVSHNQIIAAIVNANPSAFIGGNANLLHSGAILTIPDSEEMHRLSAEEARGLINTHVRDWRKRAEQIASVEDSESTTEDALRILGAESSAAAAAVTATAGIGSLGAEEGVIPPEISQRLILLEEAFLSKDLENRALKERIARLEDELTKVRYQIEIGATELALTDDAASDEAIADDEAMDETAAAAKALEDALSGTVETTVETTVQPEPAPEPTGPSTNIFIASSMQADESGSGWTAHIVLGEGKGILDSIPNSVKNILRSVRDWSWKGQLAIPGALLALILFLAVRRRKNRKTADYEDSIMLGGYGDSIRMQGDTSALNQSAGLSFLLDDSSSIRAGAGAGAAGPGEIDPLAEAEVYMAYGRDEQAETVLNEAIRLNPNRPELIVKLLEVYHKRGDKNRFEDIIKNLQGTLNDDPKDVLAKAQQMGKSVNPKNSLFTAGLAGGGAAAIAAMAAQGHDAPVTQRYDMNSPGAIERAGLGGGEDIGFAAYSRAQARAGTRATTAASDFDLSALDKKIQDAFGTNDATFSADISAASQMPYSTAPGGNEDNADGMEKALDAGLDSSWRSFMGGGTDIDASSERSLLSEAEMDLNLDGPATSSASDTVASPNYGAATDSAATDGSLMWNESATRLDLARAYIDMDDAQTARDFLEDVINQGNDEQRLIAQNLLSKI